MEEDSSTVSEIPREGEDEKEKREAFARLFNVVFVDLWDPTTKIAYGTDITKYL
jgi:hypothetical protein